jgi:hypothetical protein
MVPAKHAHPNAGGDFHPTAASFFEPIEQKGILFSGYSLEESVES